MSNRHHILRHATSALLLLLLTVEASAQNFFPTSSGEIVSHANYTLSYIEEHEQAEWVSYSLTAEMVGGEAKRKDNFRTDPSVSSASAHPDDYKGSGYDRGHLCPAASMSHTQTAMDESFYMSNMSPQAPSFNRGGWKKLEERVRAWALEHGQIDVVTGAILSDATEYIGEANRVSVPKHYYKAIYMQGREQMIAFIMPNEKISEPLESYAVTVDHLEAATGIDLFHELDDTLESRLEASIDLEQWGF